MEVAELNKMWNENAVEAVAGTVNSGKVAEAVTGTVKNGKADEQIQGQ